jgi:hypothetical protein
LNDVGALKLVGFFGDVEANDGERANEGQRREHSEEVNDEAGGMKMVECPLRDEEEDKVDSHRWGEAVDVAASGFRCRIALHDKIPFHKDN